MSEPQADYQTENCHDHGHDDDTGVPFWKRAAITEGEYRKLMAENARMRQALGDLVNALEIAFTGRELSERVPEIKNARAALGVKP